MKIHLSILVIGLITLLSANSFAEKTTAKGYYIDNKNDSINVEFFIPIAAISDKVKMERFRQSVDYIKAKGKVKSLYSENIKKFVFNYNDSSYTFISVLKSDFGIRIEFIEDPQTIFVREIVKGNCSLYFRYFNEEEENGRKTIIDVFIGKKMTQNQFEIFLETGRFVTCQIFLRMKNQNVTEIDVDYKSFIEHIIIVEQSLQHSVYKDRQLLKVRNYFSQCPIIDNYITSRNLVIDDIKLIVAKFNESCN